MKEKLIVSFFFLISFGVILVSCISYEDDVTLTAQEKRALDKFKVLIIPQIPKTSYIQNYIKDDLYLIHWLRARRLNIPLAEEMFLSHLRWREAEKIDDINDDGVDWTQFDKQYPVYFNDTVDRKGRPLGEFWFGEWNLLQGVLSGISRPLMRSSARIFENLSRRVFSERANGKEVSQAVLIFDLEKYSIIRQACLSCTPVLLNIANLFHLQYPYLFDTIYYLNTPPTFNVLTRIIQPLLNDWTSIPTQAYSNRDQWLKALEEKIDKSQRSVRFGGTIIRDRD